MTTERAEPEWPPPGKVKPVADMLRGYTRLPAGILLANRVNVYTSDYHGYNVHALVEMLDGRLAVTALHVYRRDDGESVTGEGLRRIPLLAVTRMGLVRMDKIGADPDTYVGFGMLTVKDRDRLREAGPVTETVEMVAALYQVAYAVGEGPTKYIAGTFGVNHRTAGRWVSRARERGFLPAADREDSDG